MACFIEGGGSGPRETARIVIERDGSFAVYVGSSSIGQGIETMMAQIAADALEVPIERVTVYHGSTTYLPEGYGSYGSRATVMGGSAIVQTANALIEKMRAAAGERLGVAPADTITLHDGTADRAGRPPGDAGGTCRAQRRRQVRQFEERPTPMAPLSPM